MTSIPSPALVVLVGPSGAGKSTWAARNFARTEIVSSDALRAIVGSGEADLDASTDAFALLDTIVAARVRRGLTTVVDTLGLDRERRQAALSLAWTFGLPTVAVQFTTSAELCRSRNRQRDRPVPATTLAGQLRRAAEISLADEGWDLIITVAEDDQQPLVRTGAVTVAVDHSAIAPRAPRLTRVGLQISQFPWGDDPQAWFTSVVRRAVEIGISTISVMDHLIQIPQVGRAWDPLPEAYVTLGVLAGMAVDVEIGALVTPVTFRAPTLLAKMLATLDALHTAPVFCGLGAGWYEREHEAYGIHFPSARVRLDAIESTIATLRAMWAAGTKPAAGLPETTCYPRPGAIPIIVGGAGEQRTLDLVARLADGTNLPSPPALLDRKLAVLRQHCARVGRDSEELRITVLDLPVIGQTRDDVATLVESARGRSTAAAYVRSHPAGIAADHAERYRRLAERGVDTVFVAPTPLRGADDLDRLAPVVAAVGS